MSRLKKKFLCRFCQCAFACVDSFRGSISGSGRLFATFTEARSTPVTRLLGRGMLCLGVFGRFMSGHVGSSRRKSGQSGCYFFSGHCCRCAFGSVNLFAGSISGSGRLFATFTEARSTPVTRLLGRRMLCLGVFGRFMSGQVGVSRVKAGVFLFFGHCCRCAFACVDPFVGSISGMSHFTYIIPQNSCLFGDNFPADSASGLFPLYPFTVPFFSVAHCSMCDLHFGRCLLSELQFMGFGSGV